MSYHPNSSLSDNEFLSYAEHLIDDLTSTELEIELIRRFKRYVGASEILEACEDLTPKEVANIIESHERGTSLLDALETMEIYSASDLDAYVENIQKIEDSLAVYESAINRIKTIIEEEK
jgi:hypothetical protein